MSSTTYGQEPAGLEQSSILVDQDLLCGLLGGGHVVGPFDEFAFLELGAGIDAGRGVPRHSRAASSAIWASARGARRPGERRPARFTLVFVRIHDVHRVAGLNSCVCPFATGRFPAMV
jgi:hypothetical protein